MIAERGQTSASGAATRDPLGVVHLWWAKLGQAFCRHTPVLVPHRDRLFIRCDSCGAESPGIVFDTPDQRRRAR